MGDRMRQRDHRTYGSVRWLALQLLGTALLVGAVQWVIAQPLQAQEKPYTPPPDNTLEWVKVAISGAGTLATIVGGVFVFWNVRLTASRLITERFSKAVEQLGSDKIEVRLGGIYALERIAQDSKRDHWTIMEVLTAFVREKSPVEADQPKVKQSFVAAALEVPASEAEPSPVTKDVQAALTVIGRRLQRHDPKGKRLDLRSSHLRDANLSDANLRGAYIQGANLNGADLHFANFTRANLTRANLGGANLWRAILLLADLGGANLESADLRKARLYDTDLRNAVLHSANLANAVLHANLTHANLRHANLTHADLTHADLTHADLSFADLNGAALSDANLTHADLQGANLSYASLTGGNLCGVNLDSAKLDGAMLWGVDLSETEGLTPKKLEGKSPPFLCRVKLPEEVTVDSNRDCANIPALLLERFPDEFKDLEPAKALEELQAFVDKALEEA